MKKILVSVGDQHYTDVYGSVVSSNEEAVTEMMEGMGPSYKLNTENMDGNARITLLDDTDEDNISFVVGQTFDVPEGLPYVVVRHHALEGIDIEVLGSAKTYDWAKTIKRAAVRNYLDEEFNPKYGLVDFDGTEQSCFDNGNEYDVFTILELKEVA